VTPVGIKTPDGIATSGVIEYKPNVCSWLGGVIKARPHGHIEAGNIVTMARRPPRVVDRRRAFWTQRNPQRVMAARRPSL
jgi:hypothetical protein